MISNHIGDLLKVSEIYETAPWGVTDQDDFLNQALISSCSLSPTEVLDNIHLIENKMGRLRTEKWGPRIIDIDLIFYGEEIIENPNLKIPHPQLRNRNFVLKPLMDICPNKRHPLLGKTVKDLALSCTDTGEVTLYPS